MARHAETWYPCVQTRVHSRVQARGLRGKRHARHTRELERSRHIAKLDGASEADTHSYATAHATTAGEVQGELLQLIL